jgi:hypothetical protein
VSLLVLDTSAIVAFAEGSIHVGEPISEVRDEGGLVVVPVVCLVEAARKVGDEMLHVLVGNLGSEVAPLVGERWAAMAAGVRGCSNAWTWPSRSWRPAPGVASC